MNKCIYSSKSSGREHTRSALVTIFDIFTVSYGLHICLLKIDEVQTRRKAIFFFVILPPFLYFLPDLHPLPSRPNFVSLCPLFFSSSICAAPILLASVTFHQSVLNFPGTMPLEKTQQLSVAYSSLAQDGTSPSMMGFGLAWSCIDNLSCCAFMNVTALSL